MKVRCIDNKDAEHYLELNKIYDIDDTPETDYYFGVSKGIGKGSYTEYFRSTRFEKVKENKIKVRCIDKCKTFNNLIIGEIYEAERETNNFYYWNGSCYPKWMFEEVKEEVKQMKLRCIAKTDRFFTQNKEYQIIRKDVSIYSAYSTVYLVENDIGERCWVGSEYFELVGDNMTINFKFGLVNTIVINGIEYISWYDIPLSVRKIIPTYLYMAVYEFLKEAGCSIPNGKENK